MSVAGSGKTTYLIGLLNETERFLIVTYTDNNLENIRGAIIRKFGYIPNNIKLLSYFQFLYRFCYRPYLKDEIGAKGISWDMPDKSTQMLSRENRKYYVSKGGYLYHNRLSKLCSMKVASEIRDRLDLFYDYLLFDEVQDLGGHDFDLIMDVMPLKCKGLFVGDFFQHTFETSRNGNVNKNLYKDYKKYLKRWKKVGVVIDDTTLSNSWRCLPTTCAFVDQRLGIRISSNRTDETQIRLVDSEEEARQIYGDNSIVKMFYDKSSQHKCYSINWGASKGLDNFQDVCIVLNKGASACYDAQDFSNMNDATLNKLYVACTRAKGNIYFVKDELIKKII